MQFQLEVFHLNSTRNCWKRFLWWPSITKGFALKFEDLLLYLFHSEFRRSIGDIIYSCISQHFDNSYSTLFQFHCPNNLLIRSDITSPTWIGSNQVSILHHEVTYPTIDTLRSNTWHNCNPRIQVWHHLRNNSDSNFTLESFEQFRILRLTQKPDHHI